MSKIKIILKTEVWNATGSAALVNLLNGDTETLEYNADAVLASLNTILEYCRDYFRDEPPTPEQVKTLQLIKQLADAALEAK